MEEKEVLEALEDDKYRRIIKKAIELEEKMEKEDETRIEWKHHKVNAYPAHLQKLMTMGAVDIPYDSSSHTYYTLTDREKLKELLETEKESEEESEEQTPIEEVKVDLSVFDKLIEVRDVDKKVKKVMQRATKETGIHIGLVGGPGTGKSLIASCIEKSTRSTWISGTDMTKASIRDKLIEDRPRFVIIDELDKYSSKEPIQLLSEPMESNTLTVQVSGKESERHDMPINVFATANKWNLPDNISDRFLPLRLREYTDEEFRDLIIKGFTENEGISEEVTKAVVNKAIDISCKSYRRCLQIAKISSNPDDVDWVFETFSLEDETTR